MKILIGLFVLLLSGYITMPTTSQAATLEFRPGSQSPMKGLTEMTVVGTDQKVYISQDVVVSNNDIVSAEIMEGFGSPQILIVFTRAGAENFLGQLKTILASLLALSSMGSCLVLPLCGKRSVVPG